MKDEQKHALAKCCILMLEMLIVEYRRKNISSEKFAQEAKLKIHFLKDYVAQLEDSEEKQQIKKLLKSCDDILAVNSIPQ
ncbi:MAG: hypothetical protein QHH06_02825 [Clostridiales bacterium]|nr:hypothetical protein [Eubacteriales bacterium]MDH7565403.1 hypothetical protein [Clostridiales bacterium]